MISIETIRNINKNEWQVFFSKRKKFFKGYTKPLESYGFSELTNYINEQYTDIQKKELLDDFIFNYLIFEQTNAHIIDKVEIGFPEFDEEDYATHLESYPCFNSSFSDENNITDMHKLSIQRSFEELKLSDREKELKLNNTPCLLRFTYQYDNTLEKIVKINLILKLQKSLHKNEPKNIYVGVTIDLNKNILDLGYQKNLIEQYSPLKFEETLLTVKQYIINELSFITIRYLHFDEDKLKKTLFKLFSSISTPIEEKLYESLPSNTDKLISGLLKNFNLQLDESNRKQFEAIIFQSYSDKNKKVFVKGLYQDGHVFRFGYMEEKNTRIISRNDEQEPIYTSPIYWNIKNLIYDVERIFSLGICWPLQVETAEFKNTVKIDIINSKIHLYFYRLTYKEKISIGKERLLDVRERILGLL